MLRSVTYRRYKSLEDTEVRLGAVNLLIGANAAGKSNAIDALRLLSEAVRSDMETAVSRRGGIHRVVFRSAKERSFALGLDYFVLDPSAPNSKSDMRYNLRVDEHEGRPTVAAEELRIKVKRNEPGKARVWFKAARGRGKALKNLESLAQEPFDTADPGVLALKALGFLTAYPRIKALRSFIENWQFLAVNLEAIRAPSRDERTTRLEVDASNLANVLRTLRGTDTLQAILRDLHDLLEFVEGVETDVERGVVSILLQESPFSDPTEALSASDGTLRLLALVTALHLMPEHGLLCVEEPEHGVHPLVFGPLLDLLRERCPEGGTRQVMLTTHSPDLLDVAAPEEVIVVERLPDGSTQLRRPNPKKLGEWLQDFRLGELWKMRQFGGVPQ
jgi:predicted ATPase